MQTQPIGSNGYLVTDEDSGETGNSAVAWGAVFAGATAAAALSLILLILGVGLGLSAVSPWSYNTSAIGTSTIVWVAFMQLVASGAGGYIAGRLRARWLRTHTDEVYFRDTAHGLLAWSVASLFTAALLTGAVTSIVSGVANVSATAASPAIASAASTAANTNDADANSTTNPTDYFVDMLLRSNQSTADVHNAADVHNEVSRIFVTDLQAGKLTTEDRTYLASIVAKRSDLTQGEAEAKVDEIFARATKAIEDAKVAADKARKAAAHSALWMFVALLIGAFIASWSATFGGRLRDDVSIRTTRSV
jgi:hypothetical protein